jgi:hypothetical protein
MSNIVSKCSFLVSSRGDVATAVLTDDLRALMAATDAEYLVSETIILAGAGERVGPGSRAVGSSGIDDVGLAREAVDVQTSFGIGHGFHLPPIIVATLILRLTFCA